MPLSEFKQGSVICCEGELLHQLLHISNGTVEASFNKYPSRLEKGDIIGLCDLSVGSHSQTYTAVTDVTAFSYPFDSFSSIEALLQNNANVAILLVNSMCRQTSRFLQYRSALKQEANNAYNALIEIYAQYERLCKLYAVASKKLPGLSEVTPLTEPDPIEDWLQNYYTDINDLETAERAGFFFNKPRISSGFLHKSAEDIYKAMRSCTAHQEYLRGISGHYLNNEKHDLLALVTELHFSSINIRGADAAVETLMMQLSGLLSMMTVIDAGNYQKRFNSYKNDLVIKRAMLEITDSPTASGVKQNLSDSLNIILDYSGCPEETRNKFAQNVQKYANLSDRGGSDDEAVHLRRDLTGVFYEIYQLVFIKSLNDPAPSTIIKMFLNFGYVDAALAGHENADYLYSVADSLKGDPAMGVYTLPEWLTAIYRGQKEPSRNEFDMDYNDYIREMRISRKIDAKEETVLLADLEKKLLFELENVFPVVNRITFGRISMFCPLFADHNIQQRKLEDSLVTPTLLKGNLDEIRSIDFSAFYRETFYSNSTYGLTNEPVHIEILPEIILIPNVGLRGVMWQEIEGKKRITPSRIFMPLFLEGDLKNLLIRLTGELRWEMCKRVQGVRWNDITELSLTSEFCDYLQFYKTNRDLSAEVKNSVKEDLARAKNNYKAVFASYYASWLLYESNGMQRLNKHVRRLLTLYCPFSAARREVLLKYPQFTEALNRYSIKQQQRADRLSQIIQKINWTGKEVPQELLDELEYAKS